MCCGCSDCDLSVREVIARIQRNQDQFLSKFTKKKHQEDAYYDARYAGYSPARPGTGKGDDGDDHGAGEGEGAAGEEEAAVVPASNGKGRR